MPSYKGTLTDDELADVRRLPAFAEGTDDHDDDGLLASCCRVCCSACVSYRVHGAGRRPTGWLNAASEPQNWLIYSGGYFSNRYSPLTQITPANVKNLELKWMYQAAVAGAWQTTPLVVDGVMYLTQRPNDVVALDAKTGRVFWIYRHTLDPDADRLLRRQQPRPRDSRRHAVHGHARRAPGRDRREDRTSRCGTPRWPRARAATR